MMIFVSGSYDGFKPRFSSSGDLHNLVVKQIVDCRTILNNNGGEGYAFQLLQEGVLFHKYLLLFDAYGRSGCAIVSIFLPSNESLPGRVIKEALDALVSGLQQRMKGGKADFGTFDWSFVTTQAEELNRAAVKTKSNYVSASSTSTSPSAWAALYPLDDDKVADAFSDGRFRHANFQPYRQIFLSKSLLKDSMCVENLKSGDTEHYAFLDPNTINIFNRTYQIQYPEEPGFKLKDKDGEKKETISEKDLEKGVELGTYAKSGYRSSKVVIKASNVRIDGNKLTFSLPDLKEKKARVKLDLLGVDGKKYNGKYDIVWSSGNEKKSIQVFGGGYVFSGNDCDNVWTYDVSCDGGYAVGTISVKDSDEPQSVSVKLNRYYSFIVKKDGGSLDFPKKYNHVRKKDLKEKEEKLKEDYKDFELVKEAKDGEKSDNYSIVYIATEKPKKNETKPQSSSTGLATHGDFIPSSISGNQDSAAGEYGGENKSPDGDNEEKLWYLLLDEKSKKYSIFNSKKKKTEKSAKGTIYPRQSSKSDDNDSPISFTVGSSLNADYNEGSHRLELKSTVEPNASESFSLGRDFLFEYSVKEPKWTVNQNDQNAENTVRRKLRKDRVILFTAALVILSALSVFIILLINSNTNDTPSKEELSARNNLCNLYNQIHPSFDSSYCGDSLFHVTDSLLTSYSSSRYDTIDSSYTSLKAAFQNQKGYKVTDSTHFNLCCQLKDSIRLDSAMKSKNFNVMTEDHQVSIKKLYGSLTLKSGGSEDSTQTVAQKPDTKTLLKAAKAFELFKPDNIKNSKTFDNFLRQYCGAYEIGKHLRYRMKVLYEEAKPKCGDGSRIDTYSQMYEGAKNDSIPPEKDRLYVLEQKLNPPR